MEIDEIINKGFNCRFPLYYNKTTIIDYNKNENQVVSSKHVLLNKYNINGFIANKCYKHLMKISK